MTILHKSKKIFLFLTKGKVRGNSDSKRKKKYIRIIIQKKKPTKCKGNSDNKEKKLKLIKSFNPCKKVFVLK